MANFINLTPHTVNIVDAEGSAVMDIESSGCVRLAQHDEVVTVVDGVPFMITTYGEVEGLPEPQPDTYYIVSGLVRAACPDRSDLVQPGKLVRNADGVIIGCQGFQV